MARDVARIWHADPGEPGNAERVTRIELAFSAWEADVLPLNYTRVKRPSRTIALLSTGVALWSRQAQPQPKPRRDLYVT